MTKVLPFDVSLLNSLLQCLISALIVHMSLVAFGVALFFITLYVCFGFFLLIACLFVFIGGEDKFDVDPDTGDVFIVGRHMFEVGKVYRLAISAQIQGMAPSGSTPSQLLQVYVGVLNPQFSVPVYNISFYENETGV